MSWVHKTVLHIGDVAQEYHGTLAPALPRLVFPVARHGWTSQKIQLDHHEFLHSMLHPQSLARDGILSRGDQCHGLPGRMPLL